MSLCRTGSAGSRSEGMKYIGALCVYALVGRTGHSHTIPSAKWNSGRPSSAARSKCRAADAAVNRPLTAMTAAKLNTSALALPCARTCTAGAAPRHVSGRARCAGARAPPRERVQRTTRATYQSSRDLGGDHAGQQADQAKGGTVRPVQHAKQRILGGGGGGGEEDHEGRSGAHHLRQAQQRRA